MRDSNLATPPPQYQNIQAESSRISQLTRHDKYFHSDDRANLQVGDKVFRVSTRWLSANSPRIRQLLHDAIVGSGNEIQLVRVPEVTVAQFETLLHFSENGTGSDFSMPAKSWARLLYASHFLEIASVKPRAIREVFYKHYRSFDPVTQFHYYEKCAVERTALKAAMRQLIIRPQSLDAKEMACLSYALVARVVSMRESFLRSQMQTFGTLFAGGALEALVDGWVTNG